MRRIQKVAPKNLSPTIAKPFARKKYDLRVEEVPPKWDRNYQQARREDQAMRRIQKVAPKNLSPTIAKPFARKKYDFRVEEVPPQAGPQLSAGDTKVLARLIRRYGGETVVAAAKVLPPGRGPGRPSRGLLPYYERMHLTEWLEEQAEEYRQKGSTAPYKDAERDMYQMRYGNDEPRKGRTIKKLRQQGRRDWIELLEKMLNHPLYKGQQDLREKLQHYKKHARVENDKSSGDVT